MKLAVLSDVHANREALREVQRVLRELAVDTILYLGDAVGYNADPDYCVRRLAESTDLVVRGNHDKTVANPTNLSDCATTSALPNIRFAVRLMN